MIIQPNNPRNQEVLKQFELKHSRHNLVTLNLDEIVDQYKNFEQPESPQESPEESP